MHRKSVVGVALVLGACAQRDAGEVTQKGVAPPATVAALSTDAAPACARQRAQRYVPVDAGRSGPVALVQSGERLLAVVADADERALHTIDVDTQQQVGLTLLEAEPTHVLALADGRIAVTERFANEVAIYEPDAGDGLERRCAAQVASEPLAMVERTGELLVVSGFGAQLSGFDSDTLGLKREVPLGREPRAVVLSDDGKTAFVSHMVGAETSNVDLTGQQAVRHANVAVGLVFKGSDFFSVQFSSEPRAFNQGFALVKARIEDGPSRLFLPGVSVDTGDLSEPVSSGYGSGESFDAPNVVSPVVAVIDAASEKVLTRALTSEDNDSEVDCHLPRAAAAAGDRLWVSCLGIDAVVELDARVAYPSLLEHRRFAVPAGPTGLVSDAANQRLVVWSQFVRQLSVIDLRAERVHSFTVAHRKKPLVSAELDRGRELFHATSDARISSDHRACATCHPDGRDDGLVWSSPDGRRQTKFLAGRIATTAPYGWFGEHATLEEHVRVTLANLGGSGFRKDDADLRALLAYVQALPVPSPVAPAHPQVARGKAIYEGAERGCAGCHPGGEGNGMAYNLGSGVRGERSAKFDTPSLKFVSQSAPYFHDGRYASLRELLLATDVDMGHAHLLGAEDLDALESYLRTL